MAEAIAGAGRPPMATAHVRVATGTALRLGAIRILVAASIVLGANYLIWRYAVSINWAAWPLALALLAAETYSFIDACLFGIGMWRLRIRHEPLAPRGDESVDVFITCLNEPVELVRHTVRAARVVRHPHQTFVLDDGSSPAMRAMAAEEGVGYIVRSSEWAGRSLHAKAGNLNNALFQTEGEFLLILDADQIPEPDILDRTLGYFRDDRVAFVQTPQTFYNVPPGDPFGSQASLFYGPIMQAKDGWNAAFFCGSNAVLRREALMQVGIVSYARELERRVRWALVVAARLLRTAERRVQASGQVSARAAIRDLRAAVNQGRLGLRAGESLQEVTWAFQRRAEAAAQRVVSNDLQAIRVELSEIPGIDLDDTLEESLADLLNDKEALRHLATREASPLAAIEAVRALLLAVDLDREHEALPILPIATVSVTEDMATAMRLHDHGWHSVFHAEVLARGLAPEDLGTSLKQRLRWAQGTIQVLLQENPLGRRGLRPGQRMMYFATMWSYLSGFFAVVYLAAPVVYLLFGISPIRAFSDEFFWRVVPYLMVNQLFFIVVGWGIPTWRGQQYSLALFPLWIKAAVTAASNVWFGRKLAFIVTAKTRRSGVELRLIWPQLLAMVCLIIAMIVGLGKLALGLSSDGVPILINVGWAAYDLVALSAVLDAATYQPERESPADGAAMAAGDHVRPAAGMS